MCRSANSSANKISSTLCRSSSRVGSCSLSGDQLFIKRDVFVVDEMLHFGLPSGATLGRTIMDRMRRFCVSYIAHKRQFIIFAMVMAASGPPQRPARSESGGNVRCGSKADLTARMSDFRFTPQSGLRADIAPCPFGAISGLMHRSNVAFNKGAGRRDNGPCQQPVHQCSASLGTSHLCNSDLGVVLV